MIVFGLYLFLMYTYDDQLDRRYPDLVQNSSVYDADGNRISEFKAEENRRTVGEDEFGEYLPQAVVAVEDRRFYEHYGADFAGMLSHGLESVQAAQTKSADLATQVANGTLADPAQYTMAATEASLGLQLTMAIRNKAVEAFQEIMRMQA